jgi:5-methylcytosine-specific restriction endonuclease McrA
MQNSTLILNADSAPLSLLPLTTIPWYNAIKAMCLGTVSVVEEYEDWEVHSPSMTIRVPSVLMTKRYLSSKRKISFSKDHIHLRDHYTCQYCYKVFPSSLLTMDHVVPHSHGGRKTWENIVSACGPCNHNKGDDHRIVPKRMPRKPSYYELVNIRKEFPLSIPCDTWANYLDWPEDKLYIGRNILRDTMAA